MDRSATLAAGPLESSFKPRLTSPTEVDLPVFSSRLPNTCEARENGHSEMHNSKNGIMQIRVADLVECTPLVAENGMEKLTPLDEVKENYAGIFFNSEIDDTLMREGAVQVDAPRDDNVDLFGSTVQRAMDDDFRERLRKRFIRSGEEALDDIELLELLLHEAIQSKHVSALADRLITHFGSFNDVISAPPLRLYEVKGVTAAVLRQIKLVEAAAHRLAQTRVLGRDVIQSWNQLVTYVRQRLAHEACEQLRVLFLDRKNILIADEIMVRGTVDHVPVYPREVVKRALELSASALVLVHNHPSGDPTPSVADVEMTRKILAACAAVEIRVHDHVVVGRRAVASFHELGLLDG